MHLVKCKCRSFTHADKLPIFTKPKCRTNFIRGSLLLNTPMSAAILVPRLTLEVRPARTPDLTGNHAGNLWRDNSKETEVAEGSMPGTKAALGRQSTGAEFERSRETRSRISGNRPARKQCWSSPDSGQRAMCPDRKTAGQRARAAGECRSRL